MSEFQNQMLRRVSSAEAGLLQARSAGDGYLMEVHLGDLESLARLASENGLLVPGLRARLAGYRGEDPADVEACSETQHEADSRTLLDLRPLGESLRTA